MSDKDGFLRRWSRLKEEGAAAPPAPKPPAAEPVEEDDRPDKEILAELGLPHPDDLKPGDDIAEFMAKAVPDHLRRLALRRLWRANPVLANIDGLVEYGEDYTDSATVIENLQTVYQVGKGMVRDILSEVDEAAGGAAVETGPMEMPTEAEEAAEEEPGQDGGEPEEVASAAQESADATPDLAEIEADAHVAPTRRRMSFS